MGKPLKYWNGSAWIHVGAENLSELTADATHRLVTDTEKSTWNAKISASGVTYENLNTNGDVGTGSTQVAKGDHTHAADGDKAVENIVETGLDVGDRLEITSGISNGDKIIVKGQNYVSEGTTIKVVRGE